MKIRLYFPHYHQHYLPILREISHEVTCLNILETTSGAISSRSSIVSTTLITCQIQGGPLCHIALRLNRSRSDVLQILIPKITSIIWYTPDDGEIPVRFLLKG